MKKNTDDGRRSFNNHQKPYVRSIFSPIASEYESYLYKRSDKKEKEIRTRLHNVCRFLKEVEKRGITDLNGITSALILKLYEEDGYRDWFTISIRAFLKYAFFHSLIAKDLSEAIPKTKHYEPAPVIYEPEEIEMMASSINRHSESGIRDYAIFTLIRTYALRASDIVNLRVSDVDFKHKRISLVQDKTNEYVQFKLTDDVSQALDDYIHNVRYGLDDHLFLSVYKPIKPLLADSVNSIISDIIMTSGVDIKGRKHGPHSIRASRATELLELGASLPEISAYLGHRSSVSAVHYLKMSPDILRKCALPVPEIATVSMKSFLNGGTL